MSLNWQEIERELKLLHQAKSTDVLFGVCIDVMKRRQVDLLCGRRKGGRERQQQKSDSHALKRAEELVALSILELNAFLQSEEHISDWTLPLMKDRLVHQKAVIVEMLDGAFRFDGSPLEGMAAKLVEGMPCLMTDIYAEWMRPLGYMNTSVQPGNSGRQKRCRRAQ